MASLAFSNFEAHKTIFDFIVHQKTGTLIFEPEARKLFFQDGHLVFASSDNAKEHFSQILVSNNVITAQTLEQVKGELKRGESLGKKLKGEGHADSQQLVQSLKQQITTIVDAVFALESGEYEIQEEPLPSKVPTLKIQALALIIRTINGLKTRSFLKPLPFDDPMELTADFDSKLATFEFPASYSDFLDHIRQKNRFMAAEISADFDWNESLTQGIFYVLHHLGLVGFQEPEPEQAFMPFPDNLEEGLPSHYDESPNPLELTGDEGDFPIQGNLFDAEAASDPLEESLGDIDAGPDDLEESLGDIDAFREDDEATGGFDELDATVVSTDATGEDDSLNDSNPYFPTGEDPTTDAFAVPAMDDLSSLGDAPTEFDNPASPDAEPELALSDEPAEDFQLSDTPLNDPSDDAAWRTDDFSLDDENDEETQDDLALGEESTGFGEVNPPPVDFGLGEPEPLHIEEPVVHVEAKPGLGGSPFDDAPELRKVPPDEGLNLELDDDADDFNLEAEPAFSMDEPESELSLDDEPEPDFSMDDDADAALSLDDDPAEEFKLSDEPADNFSLGDAPAEPDLSLASPEQTELSFEEAPESAAHAATSHEDPAPDFSFDEAEPSEPVDAFDFDTVRTEQGYDTEPMTTLEEQPTVSAKKSDIIMPDSDEDYATPIPVTPSGGKRRFLLIALPIVVIVACLLFLYQKYMMHPSSSTPEAVTEEVVDHPPPLPTKPNGNDTGTVDPEPTVADSSANMTSPPESETREQETEATPEEAKPQAEPVATTTTPPPTRESQPTATPEATKPASERPRSTPSAVADISVFAQETRDRFKAQQKAYSIALILACEQATVDRFLSRYADEEIYIFPKPFNGRDCQTITWGSFATYQEAVAQLEHIPPGMAEGSSPWVKKLDDYL